MSGTFAKIVCGLRAHFSVKLTCGPETVSATFEAATRPGWATVVLDVDGDVVLTFTDPGGFRVAVVTDADAAVAEVRRFMEGA